MQVFQFSIYQTFLQSGIDTPDILEIDIFKYLLQFLNQNKS